MSSSTNVPQSSTNESPLLSDSHDSGTERTWMLDILPCVVFLVG